MRRNIYKQRVIPKPLNKLLNKIYDELNIEVKRPAEFVSPEQIIDSSKSTIYGVMYDGKIVGYTAGVSSKEKAAELEREMKENYGYLVTMFIDWDTPSENTIWLTIDDRNSEEIIKDVTEARDEIKEYVELLKSMPPMKVQIGLETKRILDAIYI